MMMVTINLEIFINWRPSKCCQNLSKNLQICICHIQNTDYELQYIFCVTYFFLQTRITHHLYLPLLNQVEGYTVSSDATVINYRIIMRKTKLQMVISNEWIKCRHLYILFRQIFVDLGKKSRYSNVVEYHHCDPRCRTKQQNVRNVMFWFNDDVTL